LEKFKLNIFFELLNNPYLKNNSVISTRFVSNPEVQTKDNLGGVNFSLIGGMLRLQQEKILKENIDLLEGGIWLKDLYRDKFRYLEISFKNAFNFSYDSIDKNYIDKFYVQVDSGSVGGLYIKTKEGLYDGLSKLVPVKTNVNAQPKETINECEIDYREYKYLLQIYWYTMYSEFNIDICVPPSLYWRKNDKRFGFNGEFFKINLEITEIILFIRLLEIFPFELGVILHQIIKDPYKRPQLNSFEDFAEQMFLLSIEKQHLEKTRALALESLQKKHRYFYFEKMQFELKEAPFIEFDNLYRFDLTDEGFFKFCEFRDFLIEGPFDYPLDTDEFLTKFATALFGKDSEIVPSPCASWVELNEDFLSNKSFYQKK